MQIKRLTISENNDGKNHLQGTHTREHVTRTTTSKYQYKIIKIMSLTTVIWLLWYASVFHRIWTPNQIKTSIILMA